MLTPPHCTGFLRNHDQPVINVVNEISAYIPTTQFWNGLSGGADCDKTKLDIKSQIRKLDMDAKSQQKNMELDERKR